MQTKDGGPALTETLPIMLAVGVLTGAGELEMA